MSAQEDGGAHTSAMKTENARMQKIARRLMLAICWANGISAPICGILMIAAPGGELMMMQDLLPVMQTWPGADIFFQDLTWSGIALLLVNGVSNLICLAFWLGKKHAYTVMGIICGVLLILWCLWELVFIPNAVSVVYLVVGIVQTATALCCTASR